MVGTRIRKRPSAGASLHTSFVLCVLLFGKLGCDVVVGSTLDSRPEGGDDAGCPPAPTCNWCGGDERRDLEGCVVGYICANGADPCATSPCSQSGCEPDEECQSDDLCWPACTPQTEVCNGQDDNCNGLVDDGPTCPSGQKCLEGYCTVSPKPCTSEADCTSGQSCNNGVCNPVLCTEDSHCSGWQRCLNGFCTAKACGTNPDCGAGISCLNGLCSLTPCSTETDCGANQTCVGGSCWTQCQTDANCDTAEICISGICR